jgi:aspartokinase
VGALVGEEARFNTTYAPPVEILIPPEDAHGFAALCDREIHEGASFFRVGDVGAVSLVGQGILDDRRILRDALALLTTAGVSVAGVTTSSFRITFLMAPGAQVEESARLLHARFIERDRIEPV